MLVETISPIDTLEGSKTALVPIPLLMEDTPTISE